MAAVSFDDLPDVNTTSTTPKKSGVVSFDDLPNVGGSSGEPVRPTDSAPHSTLFGDKVSNKKLSDLVSGKQPEKTSGVGTFLREAALASPATAVGIGVGEAATAASAFLGPVAPVVGLVAGGAAGFATSYLGEKGLEELEATSPLAAKFLNLLGVDKATREAGRKEHEYAALGGQLASGGPFMSTAAKNLGQRAVGGAINVGVGSGTRAVMGEDQDLTKSAMEFGAGAAMPGTLTKFGKKIPGTREHVTSNTDAGGKPPEGATPEQKVKWLAETKKANDEKNAKAKLVETAIREKANPKNVEKMGPKHDEARKLETADTHEQGFIDERGNFLTRKEAFKRATDTGQIPKDHVLENSKEGLHSGDLRKAGVKEFEITPEKPAGVPVEEKAPTTRAEYKAAIDKAEYKIFNLEQEQESAVGRGDEKLAAEIGAEIKQLEKTVDQHRNTIPDVVFKDKAAPTWEELHDHLWGSKTVGEAFDRIHLAGIGSKPHKALLTALARSKFIREASFQMHDDYLEYQDKQGVDRKDAIGMYNRDGDHHVDLGKEGDLQTILHEAVHAGTHGLIKAGGKSAQELIRLFEKHKAESDRKFDEKFTKYREDNPQATMAELKAFAEKNKQAYGFEDAHEFIAEAFTNEKFQRILSEMKVDSNLPVSQKNKFWTAIKNAIAEGLGIKDRTGLDEVLDHGAKMIDSTKNDTKQNRIEREGWSSTDGLPSKARDDAREKLAYERNYAATKAELVKERQAGDENKYNRDIKQTAIPTHEEIIAAMEKKDGSSRSISTVDTEKLSKGTSPEVAEAIKAIDVRTIPDKGAFIDHASELFHTYGEEATLKFFDDYATELKKRSIPIPTDEKGLDDAFHKLTTWETADKSEHVIGYQETNTYGLGKRPSMLHPLERKAWDKKAAMHLKEMESLREAAFFAREHGKDVGGHLGKVLEEIDSENAALVKKITAMGGDVGQEFGAGQSRYRIQGGVTSNFKNMVSELFANRMPFSEKVGEQAHSAKERTVFQMDDGRVVELHKHPEDGQFRYQDEKGKWQIRNVHKGTEIWEWKNGNKERIGFTEDTNFKLGDSIEIKDRITKDKIPLTLVDGKVDAIEQHSPYRYLHDAEASARMANMGLRKMARDLELINNLKESKLFERVAFAPDRSLTDLPKGWVVPNSLDKIPQLRGYHFDPKTAAIIEDFAKVWDNGKWMKLTNQIVKNMMLNPLPHMFNEVMHLYNARGFTGWVNPISFARFVKTGSLAMKDVAEQTPFYREVMREGGSILGADPRNGYFDKMMIEAGKQLVDDKQMSRGMELLAKKMGTTVGGLYNGLSRASQKAMWVTRDVMYMQYIREIQKLHPEMDLKSVIAKAETHMPNYRMPSEVLGSRGLAKVLKNPNISLFSRYHYGMVKSLVNTLRDVNPANLKSAEGREHFRDGIDSMLAIGVGMAVLYPLMDEMAQAVFGEGAEQRRAGPYHLLHAGEQVLSGEKDVSALVWPVFTFNPVLLTLGELMFNKNLFSGKEIYHPHDKLSDKLGDAGKFAAKQIPQEPALVGAVSGDPDVNMSTVAKQFDIKAKTASQRAKERTARKRELAADKSRQTRRDKGTYP